MTTKINVSITVYEENGKDCFMESKKLILHSHSIRNGWDGLVELEVDGKRIAVSARELLEAVSRCFNLLK